MSEIEASTAYRKEWISDGRILCYRFQNTSPTTIDLWAVDIAAELSDWPPDQTWRMLLDISLHGNIVSAYGLRRARELSQMRPEVRGRLSILIGSRLAAQVISLVIRSSNHYRQRDVFASESSAIQWLLQD